MKRTFTLLALALFLVTPASAQLGVAVRAGTLGPGINIAYSFSDRLAVRATGSYLTYAYDESLLEDLLGAETFGTGGEEIDAEIDGEATVGALGVVLDFHPFGNFFRLSGGVTANLFEVNGDGLPTESYCFGDENAGTCDGKLFAPNRLGSFGATLAYSSAVAPYAGIGFGRVAGKKRFGLLLDLGALYTGSPELDLEASGLLAPTASTEQEDKLNEGIQSFKWYPVLSFGFAIRI